MEARKISVTEAEAKKKSGIWMMLARHWKLIVLLLIVVALALFVYGYIHTKNQLEAVKHPDTTGLNQTQQIVKQVSSIIDLPSSETPTLAKVTDVSKLQGNSLFKNAQNGDVVLVYPKSGWTLLYRPSTGKVIDYSPYQTNNGQ